MCLKNYMKKLTVLSTLLPFLIAAVLTPAAEAAMVTTETFIDMETRGMTVSRLQTLLARQDVQDQLRSFGVDPDEANARVAALTDIEIRQLQNQLDDLPAGGGAIEVIGIVFLVILILELIGVIDIFKKI